MKARIKSVSATAGNVRRLALDFSSAHDMRLRQPREEVQRKRGRLATALARNVSVFAFVWSDFSNGKGAHTEYFAQAGNL
jgi:hypothetical protein